MNNQIEQPDQHDESFDENSEEYDYAHVNSVARIAQYDDLRSAPRVTEITPAPTGEFIERLALSIYEQARTSGGTIPYTVIREVSENFIHARFTEVTVSILDKGNTIRFADQGPGINQKEKAQFPGFTSAIEPMKSYIRGVGSGLPIVKEYLDFSHGTISIEDNLGTGSVVTISLQADKELKVGTHQTPHDEFLQQDNQIVAQQEYVSEDTSRVNMGQSTSPQFGESFQGYSSPTTYHEAPINRGSYPASPYPEYRAQTPTYGTQRTNMPYQEMPYQALPPYGLPADPYAQAHLGRQDYGYQGMPQPMHQPGNPYSVTSLIPPLSQRERDFLPIFLNEGALGVTDLARITGVPQSSTYVTLSKLEQAGLIEKTVGQKRILTDLGYQVASSL